MLEGTLLKYLAFGFLYGVILAVLALVAAGAGHGTYLPLAIVSAPFSILGMPVGLFGCPVLWGLAGYLCWRVAEGKSAVPFVALLCLHYSTGLFLAFNPGLLREELEPLREGVRLGMRPFFLVGISIYVSGQLCLWACFFYARTSYRRVH